MPRATKRALAAKARELVKKIKRESTSALLFPPVSFAVQPKAEVPVEGDGLPISEGIVQPLEPTIEIDIKQESLYSGGVDLLPEQAEVEIKEEPLDPVDGELDPIGQEASRLLVETKEEFDDDNRCQFCLKLFQETGGRGIITKMKIEFVLGLRSWDTPGRSPDCCESCRKTFDQFYEFKQACLMALARPAELFVWAGNKGPAQFVDLKPNIRKKAKQMGRNVQGQIKRSRTKVSQKMESVDPEAVSDEAHSTDSQQDVKNEEFSEGTTQGQRTAKHKRKNVNKSNPTKKTYCGRCRIWFSDKAVYWQHKSSCVETHKRNKAPPPEFTCPQCSKKFLRQQELTYHVDMHNGVRTIHCRREGCTKMFYHPNIRLNHEKICGQDIQEICSICGSIFRSKNSLQVHVAKHGDPKFVCEICNKSFFSKANLKKHATVHSDERKFQCKVCGKRFKSNEANRVHQRIHTEEKPYVCHICGQRFTYNCLLKTHLEKGHDLAPPQNAEVCNPNPFAGFGF